MVAELKVSAITACPETSRLHTDLKYHFQQKFGLTNIYTLGAAHAEDVRFYFSQPYSPQSSPGPGSPGCWRTAPSGPAGSLEQGPWFGS